MTPKELSQLDELLNTMARSAQRIRIQQVQATVEANWDKSLTQIADFAWRDFNAANREATELVEAHQATNA